MTIDLTGNKGLTPKFFGDVNRTTSRPNLKYSVVDGQMADGYFNPVIRDGYLSPSNYSYKSIIAAGTPSTYGSQVTAFLDDTSTSFVVYAGTDTRLRTSGSSGNGDFTTLNAISTSVGTVWDLEIYQINSVRKLFIASESGSSSLISIYDTFSTAIDNVWSTTTASGATSPASTPYIRLVKSDNGFMYWFNGNTVYKIDGTSSGGTNGTISLALTFPTNQYLYDGLSARGKLFIAINPDTSTNIRNNIVTTHKASTECGIYVWDRSSAITALSDFYPLQGCSQIRKIYVAPNNEIRVIAVGTNRDVIMFKFTGTEFEKIHDLPPTSYPNQPKGLVNGNGVTYWFGQDGILYANYFPIGEKDYITKLLNCNNIATELDGTMEREVQRAGAICLSGTYDNASATASGFKLDYESILISWRDYGVGLTGTAADRVIRYLPHSNTVFLSVTPKAAQGDVYTGVKMLPSLSNLKHINIYCAPTLGTSTDVIATLKFYANQSTTPFKTHQVTQAQASRGYVAVELNKPWVNAIQMEIEWNTTQALGTNDFCPSVAILDYEPYTQSLPK